MDKVLYITEKPSVALEFAKALNIKGSKKNGYLESSEAVVTWCIGHLVTMSYPEKYDEKYKKWSLKDLPFLPAKYKYEVIKGVKKQFDIIKAQMKRSDISTIYVCTDSGREGEYIYRLVDEMVNVKDKIKKRVWIDSQTEEEIRKGVKNAKPLSEYDNLANAAYLRAKEDYLMGINFSRLMTLSYGKFLSKQLGKKYVVIAVGRVMTCVLGMIVQREREIRQFVKTPYYKIMGSFQYDQSVEYTGEWKAVEGSEYHMSNLLFKDIGFKELDLAKKFVHNLKESNNKLVGIVKEVKKKKETKNPPMLYNLAELQNELSKKLKLSPDETLKIAQTLYEKKMITYPRTDARVLSSAVAKEIETNIRGLLQIKGCNLEDKDQDLEGFIKKILDENLYKSLEKTKYVNDNLITDHYGIIPTGQGLRGFNKLSNDERETLIYIIRRFLAIFYPPALFNQLSITTNVKSESFFSNSKICVQEGFLEILGNDKKDDRAELDKSEVLKKLKKGQEVLINHFEIKESETTPPKRYNSGSIILAMESAGKLIEDEELREQIKGSGIGTSATRAEILKKLQKINYIHLNKKTQILTPTALGEGIYDVVNGSIPSMLKPELTASWEKGLSMMAKGEIVPEEYMTKLEAYIRKNTNKVLQLTNNQIAGNSSHDKPQKRKTKKRNVLGKCIACETGEVLENSKAFYCTNWKQNCKFTVWKNSLKLYKQEVNEEMIKALLEKGRIDHINIVLPQTNEKCTATLVFKKNKSGALELKNVNRINN